MQLANGLVSFDFDPATGSLVQVRDLRSGTAYLSDPREGRLFRRGRERAGTAVAADGIRHPALGRGRPAAIRGTGGPAWL